MREIINCPNGKNNCSNDDRQKEVVVKTEVLDFELPLEHMYTSHVGDNVASSSGSNLRPSLIGMGFSPSLVDKVIEEKGEDDFEMLLETLIEYGDNGKPGSPSSDSLDSLFGDEDAGSCPEISTFIHPKEEPDLFDKVHDDKRASLLMMNFSKNEIEFALNKLGEDAPIEQVVDFILAAQEAEKSENEADIKPQPDEKKDEVFEDTSNEALFGTMEKTLHLLEMGFSEIEVSFAMENLGSEVPISELADSIFAGQITGFNIQEHKNSRSIKMEDGMEKVLRIPSNDPVKTENYGSESASQSRNIYLEDVRKGKRPRTDYMNNRHDAVSRISRAEFDGNNKGKRMKPGFVDDDSKPFRDSTWLEEEEDEEKFDPRLPQCQMAKVVRSNPSVAKRPYFCYGSIVNLSSDSWIKISSFLYVSEPEFVNTQFFSALKRKEGYVHNLPTENRFQILPKPPMTIEDAMPQTKKWWPAWDTRKQLTCINSELSEITGICDRVGRSLVDSRGFLSSEQQRYILHQCRTLNLMWVGRHKLAPIEPENLERILGYPCNHTQDEKNSLTDRLQSLKYCFQTDTLGYHLSVLKSIFPEGITVLSIMSGIGGAEVTLDRLGIHLKAVVSVETSETNRRILRRWWQSSRQTGELIQLEDIMKLTTKKIDELMNKLGGFDFVICQNPCTCTSNFPRADDNFPAFDFTLFYEFVRILQRVRSTMELR